ncbi:MAG: hypothetical protein PUA79_02630 [Lachnospiraceae bacterium]|nr:hypothetical protein [Lachnospiraceae bacterium]
MEAEQEEKSDFILKGEVSYGRNNHISGDFFFGIFGFYSTWHLTIQVPKAGIHEHRGKAASRR